MADWVQVYSLRADSQRVEAMQEASLSPDLGYGLLADPLVGLVGSALWWAQVEDGRRAAVCLEGLIGRVVWAGMGDTPEFTIVGGGVERVRLCEGDCRRYVPGQRVRYTYVEHPWKRPHQVFGDVSEVPVEVWVEESNERMSGIAPGPAGAGYERARRCGDVVHYVLFADERSGQIALQALREGPWSVVDDLRSTCLGWSTEVWERRSSDGRPRIVELRETVRALGGVYDGGEEVQGTVWGPGVSQVTRGS